MPHEVIERPVLPWRSRRRLRPVDGTADADAARFPVALDGRPGGLPLAHGLGGLIGDPDPFLGPLRVGICGIGRGDFRGVLAPPLGHLPIVGAACAGGHALLDPRQAVADDQHGVGAVLEGGGQGQVQPRGAADGGHDGADAVVVARVQPEVPLRVERQQPFLRLLLVLRAGDDHLVLPDAGGIGKGDDVEHGGLVQAVDHLVDARLDADKARRPAAFRLHHAHRHVHQDGDAVAAAADAEEIELGDAAAEAADAVAGAEADPEPGAGDRLELGLETGLDDLAVQLDLGQRQIGRLHRDHARHHGRPARAALLLLHLDPVLELARLVGLHRRRRDEDGLLLGALLQDDPAAEDEQPDQVQAQAEPEHPAEDLALARGEPRIARAEHLDQFASHANPLGFVAAARQSLIAEKVTLRIPAAAQAFMTSMTRWCTLSSAAAMVTMASLRLAPAACW
jgi:hypothetical protein